MKIGSGLSVMAWARMEKCTHCHRKDLAGGPFPIPDPNAPQVPNLRAAGQWSLEQFETALRTGVRPFGNPLDPEYMPWRDHNMTDEELEAIWLYLQSLPGLPQGE